MTTTTSANNMNLQSSHQQEQNMLKTNTVTVGIFNPPGDSVSMSCVKGIQWIVDEVEGWNHVNIDVETIDSGGLQSQGIDVFIIPGGLPQKISQLLSNATIRKIEDWRNNHGGGFIGICAGAIVACCRGRNGRGFIPGVGVVENNALESTEVVGEVEIQAHNDAPPRFVTAVNEMKEIDGDTMIPYYNGPILKILRSKGQGKREQKLSKAGARNKHERIHRITQEVDDPEFLSCFQSNDVIAKVWATYSSDIGDDLQAAQDARMRSFEEAARNNNKQKRRINTMSSSVPSNGWVCWSCGAPHKKKDAHCCGMKRREHLMQQNGVHRICGVMLGKAAIVGIEEKSSDNDIASRRSVLFGPHPELGYDGANSLLVEAIRYCAHE